MSQYQHTRLAGAPENTDTKTQQYNESQERDIKSLRELVQQQDKELRELRRIVRKLQNEVRLAVNTFNLKNRG